MIERIRSSQQPSTLEGLSRSLETSPEPGGYVQPHIPRERELARIRWRWIAYNLFTIWGYLSAIGLLWGAYWLVGSFGVNVRELVVGLVAWERIGLGWSVALVLVVLGVVGAAGLACTFVAENWNFRLLRIGTEDGSLLRTSRGLFSTREIDRDEARLRGVQLSEPLLWRWMGMADTDVISTGLSVWSLDPATTVLPRGPVGIAYRVAAEILGTDVLRTRLTGHPRAALRRRFFGAVAVSAVVAGVAYGAAGWAGAPGWLPWLGLAVLPPASGLAYAGYRALGHAMTGDYLVFRSGALRRATAALRRPAVVGWAFRQSLLQRRLGLITVTATTAAGHGAYAALDAAERDGIRLAVIASPDLLVATQDGVVPAGEPLPITQHEHVDESLVEGEPDRDRVSAVLD